MKQTVGAALIAVVSRSSGPGGGAAARPPRPARPARPAGAAGAALGGAGGGGGGAASAAMRGARSTSVDQRNNSIVIGAAGAPITLALSFSAAAGAAPPSANVRPTLTMTSIATAVTNPATSVRLLPFTVVRAFGPAEPLHQSLQFLVLELGAALAHVHRH